MAGHSFPSNSSGPSRPMQVALTWGRQLIACYLAIGTVACLSNGLQAIPLLSSATPEDSDYLPSRMAFVLSLAGAVFLGLCAAALWIRPVSFWVRKLVLPKPRDP